MGSKTKYNHSQGYFTLEGIPEVFTMHRAQFWMWNGQW